MVELLKTVSMPTIIAASEDLAQQNRLLIDVLLPEVSHFCFIYSNLLYIPQNQTIVSLLHTFRAVCYIVATVKKSVKKCELTPYLSKTS